MLKNEPSSKAALATRLSFYLLLSAVGAILIMLVSFMYQNFYLTMASSGEILVLKADLALDTLDNDLINQTKALSERRLSRQLLDWQKVRNPLAP